MANKKREIKQHLEFLEVLSLKKKVDDCTVLGKKPRKHIQHEAKEQEALISWANLQKKVYPELEMLFAIPNGGSRNLIEATNLKKQGVRSGVPDLFLSVPKKEFHGFYIEMKSEKGRASDSQKKWIANLKKYGYKAEVCYNWLDARQMILEYLR